MNRSGALVSLLLAVSLTGCGEPPSKRAAADRPSPKSASHAEKSDLYEANATVLENADGETNLCLGVMLDSLPPQCGDIPVANWDWSQVDGEESHGGVTWGGAYHVVGSFDGSTFTLTRKPGPPADHLDPKDDFSSSPACDEPTEGWITEGQVDQQVAGRALSRVSREPEYAAGWVTHLEPVGAEADLGAVVLNAAFTANLERHEATLRKHWDGSLCVVRYERALDELEDTRSEVYEALDDMRVQTLTSELDEIGNSIKVHVVFIEESDRDTLLNRFGSDVLEITAALHPLLQS